MTKCSILGYMYFIPVERGDSFLECQKKKHFAYQTMGAATQVGLKALKGSGSVETERTWLPRGSCGMLRTSSV